MIYYIMYYIIYYIISYITYYMIYYIIYHIIYYIIYNIIYYMIYYIIYYIMYYIISDNSPGLGPGRVRSAAMTHFLLSLLTPLPPQWTLGVQSTTVNVCHSLLRATLKITKTTTGAEPNRPDQIYSMIKIILEIL